jgi:pimeloyl-ACP methyl ester carboxylesterase
MELNGTLPDETRFGLFERDPGLDTIAKAKDGALKGGERALVLLHGMAGDETTFRKLLAKEPPVRVLVFRYPNNGSLAHAAAFLKSEVGRVVRSPELAVFVGHSAGGLVFRAYAERLEGKFHRAVFLGTPHRGSNLVDLKFLVDLFSFADAWRLLGMSDALAKAVSEGHGQIRHDLLPDSLFLRWLGERPNPKLFDRYHAHAGEYLNWPSRSLEVAFWAGRQAAHKFLAGRLRKPEWVRQAVLARVDGLRLTEEITKGDGVVSIDSAVAVGAAKTWRKLHHLSLTADLTIIDELLKLLEELPRV